MKHESRNFNIVGSKAKNTRTKTDIYINLKHGIIFAIYSIHCLTDYLYQITSNKVFNVHDILYINYCYNLSQQK